MVGEASPSRFPILAESAVGELLSRTAPDLLLAKSRTDPNGIAFRDKHLGVYEGWTWRRYSEDVSQAGAGLAALGVSRGDRVAIMGDPCVEWIVADMAVMSLGAITVGVYATSAPVEIEYILRDSGTTVFIAETQEHLDKLLKVVDRLPELRRIVVIDMRALFMFDHERVMSFAALRELGRGGGETALAESAKDVRPDDAAVLVYTSGTTGNPKGVVLSHRSLIAGALSYVRCQPEIATLEQRVVAHLPLSHVVARVLVVIAPLFTRMVPFFCEDFDDFTETIRDVAPTFALMPPRFYEKFAAQLMVGVQTSTWFKRKSYALAESVGKKVLARRHAREPVPAALGAAYWLARQAVFRQLTEKVGLHCLKVAFTGSAPMPPQVVLDWQMWGVDLRDVYGVTECCGISIAQYEPFPKPGDLGTPVDLPGFEFKLSEQGEILLRSPMVLAGYWGKPEATAEVKTADGWYHTGDVAEILDDGRIKLIDRLRDIFVTLGGKTLSPQQIEKTIKGSPFISEVIAFGDGRRYIAALLELDYTTVSEYARSFKIPYTSYTSLVTHPEIVKLIEAEVAKANEHLARVEQVKVFRIIPVELDPEEGETTPTRKIKRSLIYKMFQDLIESMFEDNKNAPVRLAAKSERVAVRA